MIDVSGGQGLTAINASGNSAITIFGFDFDFPPGEIANRLSGTLTGTLRDGNALDVRFSRASTARIALVETELADADGDGVGDGIDNCPFYASADLTDSNGDFRGDVCQCGDANGDGEITPADVQAIVLCALGLELCDGSLVDTDGDGATTALDIGGTSAVLNGVIPPTALDCPRASPLP